MVIVNEKNFLKEDIKLNSSTYYKIKNSLFYLEDNNFRKIGELLGKYNFLENIKKYSLDDRENQEILLENDFLDNKDLTPGEIFFKKQEIKNSLAQELKEILKLDKNNVDIFLFCILNNLDFPFYEKILDLSKKDFRIVGKTKGNLIKLENNTETLFLNSKGEEVFQKEDIEKEKNYFLEKIDGILNNLNKQDLLFPFVAFLFLKYLNS